MIAISKNGKHLGSIVATRVIKDESDNYYLFMDGSRCVAYFPCEHIELALLESQRVESVSNFTIYQSNRIEL